MGHDQSTAFRLWLEFEEWVAGDHGDPEEDFFNMTVILADGRAFAMNVWTYKFLSRAIQDARESGEHLDGAYLPPPDLFVERLDRSLLEAVVSDMIAQNTLPPHCKVSAPHL
jgi:hypothetical protein